MTDIVLGSAPPSPVRFNVSVELGVGRLKVYMFPGAIGIDVAHDIDKAIEWRFTFEVQEGAPKLVGS
jgi:hypothetical protein